MLDRLGVVTSLRDPVRCSRGEAGGRHGETVGAFHGSGGFPNLTGRVESGRVDVLKSYRLSRFGVKRFESSRVGLGRVWLGRVGSRVFKMSRVGDFRDLQNTGNVMGRANLTRGLFSFEPGHDP